MEKRRIAVAGGIGSGKSVVSELLKLMGWPVYDCDSSAKRLMDTSEHIKSCLVEAFGSGAVDGGTVDREYLSGIVFSDHEALAKLNGIVHPAVVRDFREWAVRQKADRVFVETAILKESGLDAQVDEVWEVVAPENIRMERVMKRNGLDEATVRGRMNSQVGVGTLDIPVFRISNCGEESVMRQVLDLLDQGR